MTEPGLPQPFPAQRASKDGMLMDAGGAYGPGPDREQSRVLDVLRAVAEQEAARLHSGELSWSTWLERAARYGRFGFINTLLIAAQRHTAIDVRSYEQWRAAERQVRKGEAGIRIISRGGMPRSVFDVSQTDGRQPEIPQPATPPEAWERVRHAAVELGLHVDRGGQWAYTGRADRLIRVDPALDDLEAATALAHQLAHVLWRGDRPDPVATGEPLCRGVRRVAADSVAYLAIRHLGFVPPVPGFPPVAVWAGIDSRARPLAAIRTAGDQVLRNAAALRRRLPARSAAPSEATRPKDTTAVPARGAAPATSRPATSTSASPDREAAGPSRIELVAVQAAAHDFYRRAMAGSWVPAYLRERGFDGAVAGRWGLGYAPGAGGVLTDHLRALGCSEELLLAAGLARRGQDGRVYDAFRDRLMFAVRDAGGEIAGFIGRIRVGARGPKYLNSPRTALFGKGELLYGLHEVRDRLASGARPVIVEGPLDAIAVNFAVPVGYAAVAPCGTALTSAQVGALVRTADLEAVGVLVALDGDAAGRAAALRAWKTLTHVKGPVSAVTFAEGRDPADLLRYQGCMTVREALRSQVPLADMVVDATIERYGGTLETAEDRLAAARTAANQIIGIRRPLEIARQVSRIAERTGIPHALITDLLTDAISPEAGDAARRAAEDFPLPPLAEGASPEAIPPDVPATRHDYSRARPRR